MATSIDQAALNALAVFLRTKLADVEVSDRWPDHDQPLPAKAVTILRVGPPTEEILQPRLVSQTNIHADLPARVFLPAADGESSAVDLVNEVKERWNAHLSAAGVHLATDVAVAVSPDATDEASAITLANELRTLHPVHLASTVFHAGADEESTLTAPAATDLATLLTLVNDLRSRTNQHFAARIYTWEVRARELAFQMDVWAHYDVVRDDIVARLDRYLTDPRTMEDSGGVTLDLADGWDGGVVGFTFGAARVQDAPGSQKEREYRATYRGTADYVLTITAQSARRARTTITLGVGPTDAPPEGEASIAWAPGSPGYVETFADAEFSDEFSDEFA